MLKTATDQDKDLLTIVESSAGGWWYTARIPHRKRMIIYFTDGDLLKQQGLNDSQKWLGHASRTQLVGQFTERFGYSLIAPVWTTIADTSRLVNAAGDGWIALGDSAAAIDPLSSAGITDAIKSAQTVANLLVGEKADARNRISEYIRGVAELHARNNVMRCRYYQLENRWPASAFWRRRHNFLSPRSASS